MTINDLEGHRSLIQNYIDNKKVKCTKFEMSTFTSLEFNDN